MSDNRPFIKFYVADFLADTLDLSTDEIGSYMLLLMAMWRQRDGTIPADDTKLKRICRAHKNWRRIWANLEHLFVEENGRVTNKRLQKELFNATQKSRLNALNGAKGGEAKALKTKEAPLADATDSLEDRHSEKVAISEVRDIETPSESLLARNEGKSGSGSSQEIDPPPPAVPTASELFERFWETYPHRNGAKKGKSPAMKKFAAKLKQGADPFEIIEGARRFREDRQAVEGYAPDPATWLNQERWTDDTEPDRAAPARSPRASAAQDRTDRILERARQRDRSAALDLETIGDASDGGMDDGPGDDPSEPLLGGPKRGRKD